MLSWRKRCVQVSLLTCYVALRNLLLWVWFPYLCIEWAGQDDLGALALIFYDFTVFPWSPSSAPPALGEAQRMPACACMVPLCELVQTTSPLFHIHPSLKCLPIWSNPPSHFCVLWQQTQDCNWAWVWSAGCRTRDMATGLESGCVILGKSLWAPSCMWEH
jgi:hypothetical protein